MKVDDSKKAFPGTKENGMTLYDYYVGQAIQGLTANPNFNPYEDMTFVPQIVGIAHKVAEEAIKQKRDNYDV